MKKKKWTVRQELTAGFIVAILLSGLLSFAGSVFLTRQAFDRLVTQNDLEIARSIALSLGDFYQKQRCWDRVDQELRRLKKDAQALTANSQKENHRSGHPENDEVPVVVTDQQGQLVYNGFREPDGRPEDEIPRHLRPEEGRPVMVDGQTVGYVFFRSMVLSLYNPREEAFIQSLVPAIVVSILVGTLCALVFGFNFAGRFVRPIVQLDTAVRKVAQGALETRVVEAGTDEIGRLAANFNTMAGRLQANETARQNLLADISHELRTPVSILQANLEMLMEGVYQADREKLASLYEETQLLSKLIGDLRLLSDLELGHAPVNQEKVPVRDLLDDAVQNYGPLFGQRGIQLVVQGPEDDPAVWADPYRTRQVLRNIFDNVLKYAPESPRVDLRAEVMGQNRIRFTVGDQGPGVSDAEREKIFDRFYRSDPSRNRERGGRGLGLAICRQFILAMGGTIGAEANHPRGLVLWFELPGKTL